MTIRNQHEIVGLAFCAKCDFSLTIEDYETKLVGYDIKDFNKNINMFCRRCGAKHTATPVEYINNVCNETRVSGMLEALDCIDHMNMNMWYPIMSLLIVEKLIRDEYKNIDHINHYRLKAYSTIGSKAHQILSQFTLTNDTWYETGFAYPKGMLIDTLNDLRTIDYDGIYNELEKSGVDLSHYKKRKFI